MSNKIKLNHLEEKILKEIEAQSSHQWKYIFVNGIRTSYEVSDSGQVRNAQYVILSPATNQQGYLQVSLSIFKKIFCKRVHRLVAEAFISNDDLENKTQVNHINGNKTDNRAENLEWVTCQENMNHAWDKGLYKKGSESKSSKYTDDQIHQVCKLLESPNISYKEISEKTGVGLDMVFRINKGKNWTHISSQYKIVPRNLNKSKEKLKQYTGENANNSKYTETQVHEICQLLENKIKNVEISRTTGISQSVISSIKNKRAWASISNLYCINNKASDDVSDQKEVVNKKLVEGSTTIESIA